MRAHFLMSPSWGGFTTYCNYGPAWGLGLSLFLHIPILVIEILSWSEQGQHCIPVWLTASRPWFTVWVSVKKKFQISAASCQARVLLFLYSPNRTRVLFPNLGPSGVLLLCLIIVCLLSSLGVNQVPSQASLHASICFLTAFSSSTYSWINCRFSEYLM